MNTHGRIAPLAGTIGAVAGLTSASPALARTASFMSPSGNIGCIVATDYGARCDVRKP